MPQLPGRAGRLIRILVAAGVTGAVLAAPPPAWAGLRRSPECAQLARVLERFEWDLEWRRAAPSPLDFLVRLEEAIVALLGRHVADRCVHLNEIQALGTHNSFRVGPGPDVLSVMRAVAGSLVDAWEYSHLPLDQQFELQGIRQIELDVFHDPDGGLYAFPLLPELLAQLGVDPGPENDPDGLLFEPGTKVLHVQDLDYRSTCLTFVRCLGLVKAWSDAHPRHAPLMVLVEAKEDDIRSVDPALAFLPIVVPLEFDREALDSLDAEIRSVFPDRQLITPDDVRGIRSTLEQAVLRDGWPPLSEARGRVLFALDNGGAVRDRYVDGHPALAGRVLFTDSPEGSPEAAFAKLNDPLGNEARIAELVRRGYVVRTRADADTVEARTGDTTRRDAALASGAQWVSTDYPVPDPDFATGYEVRIPGGAPVGCNPVNAPQGCRSEALEGATAP